MNENAVIGALVAVIYILVEILKAWGFQKRREKDKVFKCDYTGEDHNRLMELRDYSRDLTREHANLKEFSHDLNKSISRLSDNMNMIVRNMETLTSLLKEETNKVVQLIDHLRSRGNGK